MSGVSQQKFQEPNMHGHVYDGQQDDGYAKCSACGFLENSHEAAEACTVTSLGRAICALAEHRFVVPEHCSGCGESLLRGWVAYCDDDCEPVFHCSRNCEKANGLSYKEDSTAHE